MTALYKIGRLTIQILMDKRRKRKISLLYSGKLSNSLYRYINSLGQKGVIDSVN